VINVRDNGDIANRGIQYLPFVEPYA
jgi:hypothetical protein